MWHRSTMAEFFPRGRSKSGGSTKSAGKTTPPTPKRTKKDDAGGGLFGMDAGRKRDSKSASADPKRARKSGGGGGGGTIGEALSSANLLDAEVGGGLLKTTTHGKAKVERIEPLSGHRLTQKGARVTGECV